MLNYDLAQGKKLRVTCTPAVKPNQIFLRSQTKHCPNKVTSFNETGTLTTYSELYTLGKIIEKMFFEVLKKIDIEIMTDFILIFNSFVEFFYSKMGKGGDLVVYSIDFICFDRNKDPSQ